MYAAGYDAGPPPAVEGAAVEGAPERADMPYTPRPQQGFVPAGAQLPPSLAHPGFIGSHANFFSPSGMLPGGPPPPPLATTAFYAAENVTVCY